LALAFGIKSISESPLARIAQGKRVSKSSRRVVAENALGATAYAAGIVGMYILLHLAGEKASSNIDIGLLPLSANGIVAAVGVICVAASRRIRRRSTS
jgi:hypothetical protein